MKPLRHRLLERLGKIVHTQRTRSRERLREAVGQALMRAIVNHIATAPIYRPR